MNIRRLLNMDAVVTSVTDSDDRDEFGDPIEETTEATWRGWCEQVQRSEDTANTDQQSERWRLFLEPAAAGLVDGAARVAIDAKSFELDGPPWPASHPRTLEVTHVEAMMRRVI